MSPRRWLLLIPILALAAWMGSRLLRPLPMPYEGINDGPRRDAGADAAAPADAAPADNLPPGGSPAPAPR